MKILKLYFFVSIRDLSSLGTKKNPKITKNTNRAIVILGQDLLVPHIRMFQRRRLPHSKLTKVNQLQSTKFTPNYKCSIKRYKGG